MSDPGVSFTGAPIPPPPTTNQSLPEYSAATAIFAESSERLVRQLFEVSIELYELRTVFERRVSASPELRAAAIAVSGAIVDLNLLIHDTSRAMLALARDRFVMTELRIR